MEHEIFFISFSSSLMRRNVCKEAGLLIYFRHSVALCTSENVGRDVNGFLHRLKRHPGARLGGKTFCADC